ncbi:hypothetical protein ES695_06685 [Candidatus Atribacteria bacterium 1244-E10-H5-B2]|nr:MAG: hypothetical protein ES695_06685 [Candidatus Atribacteria bacterium 1244-E10-H5-B2]
MKRKYFLVVLILILAILLSGCGGGDSTKSGEVITTEIKQEIKNINEGSASKYISITNIKESVGTSVSVDVEFLYEPESYDEVKIWTDSVCKSCHKVLKKYNINYSTYVWAKRPKGEGFIKIYGRTNYDKYSGIFKFKDAKELNL